MAVAIEPNDDELLRRAKQGDEEAFVALYRRRQGGLYRYVAQMSGSDATAEDVVQEVFMAIIKESCGYDASKGSLSSYLYGIARNLTLRRIERNRHYVPIDQEDGPSIEIAGNEDPDYDLARAETVGLVRQAVLALPEHYRDAVVLCDLHEMSYVEAADVIGCAVGTVRSRLHRGRSMLGEWLRGVEPAPRPGPSVTRCFA
jgi:RNA polymerase sigma-70 factor (ECF subfamily)